MKKLKFTYYFIFEKIDNSIILLNINDSLKYSINAISNNISNNYVYDKVASWMTTHVNKLITFNISLEDKYIIKHLYSNRYFDFNKGVFLVRENKELNTDIMFKSIKEVTKYIENRSNNNPNIDFSIIFWKNN